MKRLRRVAGVIAAAFALVPFVARADGVPAPAASSAPAPSASAPAAPKLADPTGTPVRITSTNLDTDIFLAKGDVPPDPQYDVFERIGTAPLEIRLAPGVYTIQSSNPTSSMGHARFHVEQNHTIDIEVRNGDASVRTIGAVLEGLGVTAMLAGVLVIVAISPHDQNFNRWTIGMPLLLGGAASLGVGLGMSFAGATNMKMPASSLQAHGVSWRFSF